MSKYRLMKLNEGDSPFMKTKPFLRKIVLVTYLKHTLLVTFKKTCPIQKTCHIHAKKILNILVANMLQTEKSSPTSVTNLNSSTRSCDVAEICC